MADPSFVSEQAIRYFLNQWYYGLTPTLYLKTLSNGEICVNAYVKTPKTILNSQKLVNIDNENLYNDLRSQTLPNQTKMLLDVKKA